MTVDEAVRDLLAVSADIRRVAVIDEDGGVAGGPPGADATALAAAAAELWRAAGDAAARASADGSPVAGGAEAAALEHVVVPLEGATVIAVAAGRRRIVAVASPDPVLGLALFDLRTCLADAFPDEVDA